VDLQQYSVFEEEQLHTHKHHTHKYIQVWVGNLGSVRICHF